MGRKGHVISPAAWLAAALFAAALSCAACRAWAQNPSAAEPVINIYVFLSPDCPTCEPVKEEALKKTARDLKCRIVPRYFDVEDMENYKVLVAFERKYADTENDLPVVIVGGELIGGVEEIKARLHPALSRLAAAGGAAPVPLPTAGEIEAAVKVPAVRGSVHVVFFDRPGCRKCARAGHMLRCHQAEVCKLPSAQVVIDRVVESGLDTRIWLEVLCERAGLPEDERLVLPAVFVGSDALVDRRITDSAFSGLLSRYRAGVASPAPATPAEDAAARERLNRRFQNVGFLTVLAGGLIDGVNPCAFVTLIFLVGYLTATGCRGRQILLVGASFMAAVFVAYLAIGIGLAGAIETLGALPAISKAFTWALIAMTAALSIVSLWDAAAAMRGRAGEMKLGLPGFLRRRLNLIVARQFRTRTAVMAALAAGVAVSFLEFACTGQIYLPLIRLMISFSASRARAFTFLLVYNTAFVVPLAATFVAAYAGSTSEQLTGLMRRHLALGKMLAALLFAAMAALLIILR